MGSVSLRALVLDIYARVREQGHLADRVLHHTLRAHPSLHSRERRHVAQAVYGMLRLERRLDYVFERALAASGGPGLRTLATPDLHRLRYAGVLVSELGQTAAVAAAMSGLSTASARALETIATLRVQWPSDATTRLALEHSLPDWAARSLHAQYGADAPALAAALNRRAPLALRTNTLKTTRNALAARLASQGVSVVPGALSPWALLVEGHPNVFSLAPFKDGSFEVQDEGSQLVALACGARPGDQVVDACAGAGGKTLALAAMMENRGRILACDVTDLRLADLRPRARRAGVFTVNPRIVPDGAAGDAALAPERGRAAVVLVDAPCTGTGSWRRNPDARWRMTEADAATFPPRQRSILERASTLVRPGGRLVYATCSLLRAENDEVAAGFARDHADFQPEPLAGLPAQALDDRGRLLLLPHVHGTDGFFAAAFRRK